MQTLSETAFAKINLALHVRRRRNDGYHELETLFAFVDSGDELSGHLATEILLDVGGPFGNALSSGADNLVLRVAHMLRSHFALTQGAALKLEKNLPVASGIGGGSADAAATARLLRRLWSIDATDRELAQLLAPLGADIPACVQSLTVYGDGTGARLTRVSDTGIQRKPVLLVNPIQPVATGPVFLAWDGIDRGGLDVNNALQAALDGRNDLETPAISICPAISEVLNLLAKTDAELVRMSGSGATCFALFAGKDARDVAQRTISETCPDWWTMASSLR